MPSQGGEEKVPENSQVFIHLLLHCWYAKTTSDSVYLNWVLDLEKRKRNNLITKIVSGIIPVNCASGAYLVRKLRRPGGGVEPTGVIDSRPSSSSILFFSEGENGAENGFL